MGKKDIVRSADLIIFEMQDKLTQVALKIFVEVLNEESIS